ncbi:MAG: site-specific DNA-methyltransferase [Flavobacteriales bacterium]|nr:site-specific DNA-methyltransferase [Flavobacteriales bacterium]
MDAALRAELERLTEEDAHVWTAPNYNRREFVHSFFQYPAMMVPVVQKRLIETIKNCKPEIERMLDPFMGSSTSIVAAMQCGLHCTGQDINPLAVLLSRVKCGPYNHVAFGKDAGHVLAAAKADVSIELTITFSNWRKWFREDVAIDLSRLVRAIRSVKRLDARRLMWITLAETVRLTSNDRTSTFKLHARPIDEIEERFVSPINTFERLIRKNIEDIKLQARSLTHLDYLSKGRYTREVHLMLQNSGQEVFQPVINGVAQKYDLLVSSSPYGDNQTTVPYGQHAFLALQWIDLEDIDHSVDGSVRRTANEIDRRSLGGSLQDAKQEELAALFDRTPTLSRIAATLKMHHPDKVKKVVSFVRDFDRALDKAVAAMASNGYFIWTMGNRHVGGMEIENDKILIELMQAKDCILVTRAKREILNKRMAQRNDSTVTMSMEDILIFRKTTE